MFEFAKRRLGCLTAAAIVATLPVQAQQVKVTGHVVDPGGAPVAKVAVVLEPQDSRGARGRTLSNKKGVFFFGLLRPGAYALQVEGTALSLAHVTCRAIGPDDAVAWEVDTAIGPGQPVRLEFADGMEATLDLVLAPPTAKPAASSVLPEGTVADAALAPLAEQIKAGDCARALPGLEAHVASTPDSARGHYLLAYCEASEANGDCAAAERILVRVPELNPSPDDAATSLGIVGRCLVQLGRVPEAITALERSVAADPDSPMADETCRLLEALKKP